MKLNLRVHCSAWVATRPDKRCVAQMAENAVEQKMGMGGGQGGAGGGMGQGGGQGGEVHMCLSRHRRLILV